MPYKLYDMYIKAPLLLQMYTCIYIFGIRNRQWTVYRFRFLYIVPLRCHVNNTIPAVRLTYIACFSPISQSILNRFWWNFARTIFESRDDYREIFINKYYVVQKLDHLTCSKFEITTSLYKPIKLVKLKFVFSPELHYMPDGLTF